MVAFIFKKCRQKMIIIGPVYDQLKRLNTTIQKLTSQYDFTIFNGNLCYPNHNLSLVEERIQIMDQYLKSNRAIYNLANYDLLLYRKLYEKNENNTIFKWLENKSNVIMIEFENQSSIIVTGGGVTAQMNKTSLLDNWETSFVTKIANNPWHKNYGGAYGYIVSNNPLTDKEPQFYNYSAQIGNSYNENGTNVYAQEINQQGLGRTILL